jgi:hypothetical protein
LLRLEHDSTSITVQSQKNRVQSELQKQRGLLRQLVQRLNELDNLGENESDVSSNSSDDGEEDASAPSYAPARGGISAGLDHEHEASPHDAATQLTSTLRSRKLQQQTSPVDEKATSTGTSLFPKYKNTSDTNLAHTEAALSDNRAEQEDLASSLLEMAQRLKNQSVQFGTSLESEKSILDRAAEGLDRNTTGMESAQKRMSTLRRMTEGKGWWARMQVYAMIFGLWIAAFLVMFIMPKLRF